LHRILGLAIAGANISAMVVATGVNFLFNRNWSFRSKGKISQSFILYISLILFNMVFTTWLITVLAGWGMADYIAKVLVMGAATLWNFLLYKKVIFV